MTKSSVLFQKNRSKTIGGVPYTRVLLLEGAEGRTDRRKDRMPKIVPSLLLEKAGDKKNRIRLSYFPGRGYPHFFFIRISGISGIPLKTLEISSTPKVSPDPKMHCNNPYDHLSFVMTQKISSKCSYVRF